MPPPNAAGSTSTTRSNSSPFATSGASDRTRDARIQVEAVPAVAGSRGTECLTVLLPVVVDGVVFAGDGEHAAGLQFAHHLLDLVELARGRQVGQVAGVHDEIRAVGQRVDLADRFGEGVLDRGVSGALE